MQAIILAAGMGKRLKELTKNNTKCMISVNNQTLIQRMLRQIENKHLSQIIIVVGYQGQKLIDYVNTLNIQTPVIFINNPVYDKTNNIYSLALAKEFLCKEDTLLFESDIIFEDAVLDKLIEDPRESLVLVDKYEPWMDGTCLKLSDDDAIEEFISKKNFRYSQVHEYYKTVNIYKFSRHFSKTHYVPFLEAYQAALGQNEYYEQVLRVITMLDDPEIRAKRLSGELWYEIDDIQDLDIAETLFANDEEERLSLMQKRYGGYWRYPRLLDFCYLVNPYFPPERLKDELKSNFDELLTSYPSGMHVNSLLAAKNFDVHQENIIVGNGAAELIKLLMEHLRGKTGFVKPTFEEYPHRYSESDSLYFLPDNPDFSYTEEDLMSFFENRDINSLVIVNPDNPSGNYISKKNMLRLISWAGEKNITLIVDESFVDFSDEENSTLIDQKLISENPHLIIIKSISKSYGIPGLRLGILVSGNITLINDLKKEAAIWNINSFAEFYMQAAEKYRKDYAVSLRKIRKERKRFAASLSQIKGIRVIPSQANFIMVELENGTSSKTLTRNLLSRHDLLVKDLSSKTKRGNYLRIAIRNTNDNDRLLKALSAEMNDLQ